MRCVGTCCHLPIEESKAIKKTEYEIPSFLGVDIDINYTDCTNNRHLDTWPAWSEFSTFQYIIPRSEWYIKNFVSGQKEMVKQMESSYYDEDRKVDHYIFRPYITRNGVRYYAKNYGIKAFKIPVYEESK